MAFNIADQEIGPHPIMQKLRKANAFESRNVKIRARSGPLAPTTAASLSGP